MSKKLVDNLFTAMQQKVEQSLEFQEDQQRKVEILLKESQEKIHDALLLIQKGSELRKEALLALHHNAQALRVLDEESLKGSGR